MQAFELIKTRNCTSAAVFSSPHSGTYYPPQFLRDSQLDAHTLRSSEDAFVDDLFSAVPNLGAPLFTANYPRAFVDLNRAENELDPAIIAIPAKAGLNPRISAGLGVIPRVVAEGRIIRSGKMRAEEAEHRLATAYRPYHRALNTQLRMTRMAHGTSLLIDCHSMPHAALANHSAFRSGTRPDIILGDRFGASCAPWISNAVAGIIQDAGFSVARNAPFAGGFITQTYGRPTQNSHALQIEIDRSLYMDEIRIVRSSHFEDVKQRLTTVAAGICALISSQQALAAE